MSVKIGPSPLLDSVKDRGVRERVRRGGWHGLPNKVGVICETILRIRFIAGLLCFSFLFVVQKKYSLSLSSPIESQPPPSS